MVSRRASLPPARVTLSSAVRLASTRAGLNSKSRARAIPGAAAEARAAVAAKIALRLLWVIAPRRIVVFQREHERRRAPNQRFDQHQLLVRVVDERRLADPLALLALRKDVERPVVVGRDDRVLARG